MTDSPIPSELSPPVSPGPPVRGWVLTAALIVFAVLVFAVAGLGWAGVVIIVALMAGAYTVLIRWSR
ncbi:hypothetical protein M6D93_12110 [Jatrophihabitans telluris]|uniref:Uncharacterized protein n=1 Tax=Jatrophihabitans telluris TaxID=2038343 RepID=A0ABY4QVI2_9ACTN|nr:hypothetical protein [Jatrophihabitans telluris]UQX87051.1 hypothetical protein M6D93_12110 [Jatrophihabitans telluris]